MTQLSANKYTKSSLLVSAQRKTLQQSFQSSMRISQGLKFDSKQNSICFKLCQKQAFKVKPVMPGSFFLFKQNPEQIKFLNSYISREIKTCKIIQPPHHVLPASSGRRILTFPDSAGLKRNYWSRVAHPSPNKHSQQKFPRCFALVRTTHQTWPDI